MHFRQRLSKSAVVTGTVFAAVLLLPLQAAAEPLTWVGCGISKLAYASDLAKAFKAKAGIDIAMQGGGATRGIRDVGSLSADIGGSCRPVLFGAKEEHQTKLVPVGWDALAVIVHPDNPVNDITIKQLQSVLVGGIRNWNQLGGADEPLKLFARKGKISGVGYTARTVLFNDPAAEFGDATLFPSTGPLEKAVEKDSQAIALTGISSARKRNVKILSVNGKQPTYQNVKTGKYLMYRPLYLAYNPANPRMDDIKKFLKFAYSAEGQEIMRANGTVPYLEATNLISTSVLQRLDGVR